MISSEIDKWLSECFEGSALPDSDLNSCEAHYRTWKDQHPQLRRAQKLNPATLRMEIETLKSVYSLQDSLLTIFQYVLSWISKPQAEKNNEILAQIRLFDNGTMFKPYFSGVPMSKKDWCFLHAVSKPHLNRRLRDHREGICNWYSQYSLSLIDLGSMEQCKS